MPPTEKPARFINKLLEQTKTASMRIHTLETALVAAEQNTHAQVKAAITELEAQHAEDQRAANTRHAQILDQLTGVKAQLATTVKALEAAQIEIINLTMIKRADQARIEQFQNELDGMGAERADLAAKREALTLILAKVQGRMRRKEQEDERAILNRKALSSTVPALNRR